MIATEFDVWLCDAIFSELKKLYKIEDGMQVSLQQTRREFTGDRTLVVFPYLKISKKGPEQTAEEIGEVLKSSIDIVENYNVIKGFLNLEFTSAFWLKWLSDNKESDLPKTTANSAKIMVEYSSPNTNKPLHLGHIRNNLLGYSVSEIFRSNGNEVVKVQVINDRGIHICKSMLAWEKYGNAETPESSGKKGDHLVGDYYVKFDQVYKSEIKELINQGIDEKLAKKQAPILLEAQQMLRNWEQGDEHVRTLWQTMNQWVYDGFDVTYHNLGVDFDKLYYESDTYLVGKEEVMKGLEREVFYQKDDGSVWVDLTEFGLDQKLLIRSDGTTVYMTQDIGTAILRFNDFPGLSKMIYTVGDEQNYHFKVLFLILKKLGYSWAQECRHLSYGMVELPSGKMKSREGTVVDADDLISEMIETARKKSEELGKLDGIDEKERENLFRIIGLGALKYFILKVDPKKQIVFNPEESIEFVGNTGPFIQYTHARIKTLLSKSKESKYLFNSNVSISDVERDIVKQLHQFTTILKESMEELSPSLIANYTYELVKMYNQFYQSIPILKEEKEELRQFRLALSLKTADTIKYSMKILGIEVPDRM